MKLGSKVRALRLEKRMTIKEVAQGLGVSASTYRDWEYGRKIPAEHLQRLASVFQVSTDELIGTKFAAGSELMEAISCIEKGLGLLRKLRGT